jgi:glycerol-3-phosphate cytidylyltransferase
MRIITFGTFDLFHIGHLNILNKCKEYGDVLIVGVSSDNLNFQKKKQFPIINEKSRITIIQNIKCVDIVFTEEKLELKREYIKQFNADILIMGDDWKDKFDYLKDICKVIYLPRTPNISTTYIKNTINNSNLDVF